MSQEYWKDGSCSLCGIHTYAYCDNCKRFICDRGHMHSISVDAHKRLDFCPECWKKVRPGTKISGVLITNKMMG